MATNDFNHDGLPDILSMNNSGSITIVINRGGDFNAPRGVAFSQLGFALDRFIAGDLKSADLNGDGALDLVVAGSGLSDAAIMFGAGRNKFSDPVLISSGVTNGLPITVEIQDFNNDGKLDLAVLYATTRNVVALLGDGQGGFTPSATINFGPNVFEINSADFNNDGNLDLVVRGVSSGLALYLGDGQGGFTQSATQIGVNSADFVFTAGDFNGDGMRDLAFSDVLQGGIGHNIVILHGDGQGGFGQPSNVMVQEELGLLSAKDLNLDGRDDLIYTHSHFSNHAVFVVLSNPGGGFDAPVAYQVSVGTRRVVTTDINGDGKLDLISSSFDSGTISLLLGDSAGGFRQQGPLPVFGAPSLIATGDFDRDGRIDLALPRSGVPVIAIINNKSMCIPQSGVAPASSASGK
jgi:hypothetical protein